MSAIGMRNTSNMKPPVCENIGLSTASSSALWFIHLAMTGATVRLRLRKAKFSFAVVPGFWIKLEWLWQGPESDTQAMAREIGIVA